MITVSKIINEFVHYSLMIYTSRPSQTVVVGSEATRHIAVWQDIWNLSEKNIFKILHLVPINIKYGFKKLIFSPHCTNYVENKDI